MGEKLTWHNEKRKVKDLVPWDKNPRKLTDGQKQQLEQSLEKFNLVEIPAINTDNKIIAGHQRIYLLTLRGKGEEEIDVRVPSRTLTQEEYVEYNLRSNKNTGEWDWEILKKFEHDVLRQVGFAEAEIKRGIFKASNEINRSLIEDYIVPPFSIFDTKQGYWQDRKREWVRQIGDSGEGRSDALIGDGLKSIADTSASGLTGTSIFDPVLTEVLYTWYTPRGGLVVDPFAGGNVRGAVAGLLGYKYRGTDVSLDQIAANQRADEEVKSGATWIHADGLDLNKHVQPEEADFLLTCPPYYDLEQYSDAKDDISNKATYEEFRETYTEILKRTHPLLKAGAFAVVVVGNIRGKDGLYHDLVGDTVKAMTEAGYGYYNEVILATAIATARLRARKTFEGGKKVVKIHQNVLTFWKKDKEIQAKGVLRELLLEGRTAVAHQNVLMFKKGGSAVSM